MVFLRAGRCTFDAMKLIAMMVTLIAGPGCALLFQEHLAHGYISQVEPRCSTAPGWYLWDGLIVLGDAVLLLHDEESDVKILSEEATLGVLVYAVAHLASFTRGREWAVECEDARRRFDEGGTAVPPGAASVQRARTQRDPPVNKGFFCSSSPTVSPASICKRNEATCEQGRTAAMLGVPDMSACALVDVAWCFAPGLGGQDPARCAGIAEACAAQHDAAVASGDASTVGTCVEVR